jgi:hypothetical protein
MTGLFCTTAAFSVKSMSPHRSHFLSSLSGCPQTGVTEEAKVRDTGGEERTTGGRLEGVSWGIFPVRPMILRLLPFWKRPLMKRGHF